jgi:hypothetical protein
MSASCSDIKNQSCERMEIINFVTPRPLSQEWLNSGSQVSRATKFCAGEPRILRCFLPSFFFFGKFVESLNPVQTLVYARKIYWQLVKKTKKNA